MIIGMGNELEQDRTWFNFANSVIEKFAFLEILGFSKVEALPTVVRSRNGDVEAHVYHGRQSYEMGFEVARNGAQSSISEVVEPTIRRQPSDIAVTQRPRLKESRKVSPNWQSW